MLERLGKRVGWLSFGNKGGVRGDLIVHFNTICCSQDNTGGKLGGNYSLNWLNDFVAKTGAIDLGLNGP